MDQRLTFIVVSTDAGIVKELRSMMSSDDRLRIITFMDNADEACLRYCACVLPPQWSQSITKPKQDLR